MPARQRLTRAIGILSRPSRNGGSHRVAHRRVNPLIRIVRLIQSVVKRKVRHRRK
jgi:hypothetical protein